MTILFEPLRDGLSVEPHPASIQAGVDRVELEEFNRLLATGGDDFLRLVYTDQEREHCHGRVERLATRFAAKEATSKALGTGLRGISLQDIEVVTDVCGKPHIQLHARARERADALRIRSISVSLTHTSTVAEAFVVALCADGDMTDSSMRKDSKP